MENSEPKYKAVVLKQFKSSEYDLVERPLPKLQPGEVLVKVFASPINPLDLIRINGGFAGLQTPFTPGSEASGTVVDANVEEKEKLIGKKVSALAVSGAWAEYIVTKSNTLIVHDDDVDLEQAACGWVNPVTAYGMYHQARKLKAEAIAITGGNSALGKMMIKIAAKENMPLISIVRSKKSKIAELVALGQKEEHILDSTDADFEKQYVELAQKLSVKCVFDCVAGPQVGILISGLVKGGSYFNFGSLSGQPIGGIDPTGLRWGGKSLHGFVSTMYLVSLPLEEQKEILEFIKKNMKTIFASTINNRVPAEPKEVAKAVEEYVKSMSDGKILITFK